MSYVSNKATGKQHSRQCDFRESKWYPCCKRSSDVYYNTSNTDVSKEPTCKVYTDRVSSGNGSDTHSAMQGVKNVTTLVIKMSNKVLKKLHVASGCCVG